MTEYEAVNAALLSVLDGVGGAAVERNADLALAIPDAGHVVILDGEIVDEDRTLGRDGVRFVRQGNAIEIYVAGRWRSETMDALVRAVRDAIDADPTLGGVVHHCELRRDEAGQQTTEGGDTIAVTLLTAISEYQTTSSV